MHTSIPSLIDLEAFEAAARHGSFVAAAAELHLTASAISHRVRSLERQLADGRLCTAGDELPMAQAHYLVQPSSRTGRSADAELFAGWLRSLAP